MKVEEHKYWTNKRLNLNKWVLLYGLVILPCIVLALFLLYSDRDNSLNPNAFLTNLGLAFGVYAVYMGLVNLIFIVIEQVFVIFPPLNNIRDLLYKVFLITSLLVPVGYLMFLLNFLRYIR